MTETEYNELTAEVFESAIWNIKSAFDSKKTTDAEKLKQIKAIVREAVNRYEELSF